MARLTINQIERARVAILENARALADEAELLLKAGHHARAYALSHLATEELAKLPMIVRAGSALDAGRAVDWGTLNRRLSSHKSKISMLYVFERLVSGNPPANLDQFMREREVEREARNRKKNEALYSHMLGEDYRRPSDAISRDEAEESVTRARQHLEFFDRTEAAMRGAIRGSGDRYKELLRELESHDPEPAA